MALLPHKMLQEATVQSEMSRKIRESNAAGLSPAKCEQAFDILVHLGDKALEEVTFFRLILPQHDSLI